MSKISELSDGGVIQGGDTLIAVRSGGNVKVTYGGTTTANIDGGTIDGTVIGGTTPAAGNFTTGSFTGNVSFGDNDKAIFGAGSDLQIYHDASNSYIIDNGDGSLFIRGNSQIQLQDTNTAGKFFVGTAGGAATLYHNNLAKLATTSTGVDVTGSLNATGIIEASDGTNGEIQLGLGTALTTGAGTYDSSVRWNGSSGNLLFSQGAVEKMRITGSGIDVTGTANADKITTDSNVDAASFTSTGSTYVDLNNGTVTGRIQTISSDFFIGTATTGCSLAFKSGNNVEAMRIDSSGNVGIGTDDPTVASGNGLAIFDSTVPRIQLRNSTSGDTSSDGVGIFMSGSDLGIENRESSNIIFYNNTEKMRIDSSGNVGIGASSPSSFNQVGADTLVVGSGSGEQGITIYSGTANNGVLAFADGTTTTQQYQGYIGYNHSSNFMRFFTGAEERMRIDSSGHLLVGTDTFGYAGVDLTVGDTADSQNGIGIQTSTTGYGYVLFGDGTGASAYVGQITYKHDDNFMAFNTAGAEAMRIDSSGNVKIGTNTDRFSFLTATTANLQIDGGVLFEPGSGNNVELFNYRGTNMLFGNNGAEDMRINSSGALLVNTTTASFSPQMAVQKDSGGYVFESVRTGTGTEGHIVFVNGNGAVGTIQSIGTSTAYNTSSDQRLKDNIVDAPSASDDIDAIQVRSFDWKADGSHQKYGMIAQELQSVAPEAVSAPEDPEEMMGVDYSKLVPMLVKEIQSLRARVAQLEGAN